MSKIQPTRKLNAQEKRVLGRTIANFPLLGQAEAELLTSYAEQSHRYGEAKRETERNPTIMQPQFNRSTGNHVGERPVRNPAFATMREAATQVRLLEKRLTSLNDKRRAEAEREQRRRAKIKPVPSWANTQARARAAHELQTAIEDAIRRGEAQPDEATIAELGQELIRVGYKPTSKEGDYDLRIITLSWIESRYWAAFPDACGDKACKCGGPAKTAGQLWVEKELIAAGFYDDLLEVKDSPFPEVFAE